jgi:hypothetical protein
LAVWNFVASSESHHLKLLASGISSALVGILSKKVFHSAFSASEILAASRRHFST